MENSINLAEVQGTGREGRVLKEDVILHLEGRSAAPAAPPPPPPASSKPQAAPKPPAPKPVILVKPSVMAGTRFLVLFLCCKYGYGIFFLFYAHLQPYPDSVKLDPNRLQFVSGGTC
jgi:hypothetical protein